MSEGAGIKRRENLPDLYGTVTVAERDDGYFYIKQPREVDAHYDEQVEIVAFSRETAEKLHAKLGAWLANQ